MPIVCLAYKPYVGIRTQFLNMPKSNFLPRRIPPYASVFQRITPCLKRIQYRHWIYIYIYISFTNFFRDRYSSNTVTRQINDISHSRPRTQFSARTPSHCIPTIWNALTPQMKQMINRNQLKRTITQSMISSYDSNVACDNPRCAECAPPN